MTGGVALASVVVHVHGFADAGECFVCDHRFIAQGGGRVASGADGYRAEARLGES